MDIFNIYNHAHSNIDIRNNSIDIEIREENGLNNIIYFVDKNNEKIPTSKFSHNIMDMKILSMKENRFGKVEMFLSFGDVNNIGFNNIYKAIKGFEETISNKIKLNDCDFSSNIINEYAFRKITLKKFKLNVDKFLEKNNKKIEDYPINSNITCNITCNKLWINPEIKKYGIWWSVNDIQITEDFENYKEPKNTEKENDDKKFISDMHQLKKNGFGTQFKICC